MPAMKARWRSGTATARRELKAHRAELWPPPVLQCHGAGVRLLAFLSAHLVAGPGQRGAHDGSGGQLRWCVTHDCARKIRWARSASTQTTISTVVFTMFSGFYFWWPKFTGKKLDETLGSGNSGPGSSRTTRGGFANSLEWVTSRPPPRHNFTRIPGSGPNGGASIRGPTYLITNSRLPAA